MQNNLKDIYLYHGSDVVVKEPLLSKCNYGKDFGRGFYMSFKPRQAINFSKIIMKRNGSKHNFVSEYKLSDLSGLNVYKFKDADAKWLECVVNYRSGEFDTSKWDKYDVIIGKIADDDTSRVINAYMSGAYGEINSKKAIDFAISMFEPNRLDDQICFKSQKALKHILYMGYYEDEP